MKWSPTVYSLHINMSSNIEFLEIRDMEPGLAQWVIAQHERAGWQIVRRTDDADGAHVLFKRYIRSTSSVPQSGQSPK